MWSGWPGLERAIVATYVLLQYMQASSKHRTSIQQAQYKHYTSVHTPLKQSWEQGEGLRDRAKDAGAHLWVSIPIAWKPFTPAVGRLPGLAASSGDPPDWPGGVVSIVGATC